MVSDRCICQNTFWQSPNEKALTLTAALFLFLQSESSLPQIFSSETDSLINSHSQSEVKPAGMKRIDHRSFNKKWIDCSEREFRISSRRHYAYPKQEAAEYKGRSTSFEK